MAEEHKHHQPLHLHARYTVKRMNAFKRVATTEHVSRKVVILNLGSTTASNEFHIGELVDVEIMLPVLPGLPERYIFCQCHLTKVDDDATGTHMVLEIDTVRIRGEQFLSRFHNSSRFLM